MNYTILHVNIERDKHLESMGALIREKQPDVMCFQEILEHDIPYFLQQGNYRVVFTPKYYLQNNEDSYIEGYALFSKYPFKEILRLSYGENDNAGIPFFTKIELAFKEGKRPVSGFDARYDITTACVQFPSCAVRVATAHFPVVDYCIDPLPYGVFPETFFLDQHMRVREFFDRFEKQIQLLSSPLIFTADMNQDRSMFLYQSLAHILVDRVPAHLGSSMDPNLHRVKNLPYMVDTIMSSPDIHVISFEIIEGVSDHKAFFMTFTL